MKQSMHELLPEMAWQVGVLQRLDTIIGLLQDILDMPEDELLDDMEDVSDYVSM